MRYRYQRKTRDRYTITARKKGTRSDFETILDTYDGRTYSEYYTAINYPVFNKNPAIKWSILTHEFRYSKKREKIDPPPTLCVCERCLWAIESREGRQVTRRIYIDEDDPRGCDWCEENDFDTLYELL